MNTFFYTIKIFQRRVHTLYLSAHADPNVSVIRYKDYEMGLMIGMKMNWA